MFEDALIFTMKIAEVGSWFKLDEETKKGLISTSEQRKKVGYVNDPADRGGETKFGIAQSAHPALNIKTLDWEQAKAIYEAKYWLQGQCNKMDGRLGIAHFDACVNHGVKKANQFIQRAVGVTDDGVLGDQTFKAIGAVTAKADIIKLVVAERRKFFSAIVEHDKSQQRFLKGWMNRCDALEKALAC